MENNWKSEGMLLHWKDMDKFWSYFLTINFTFIVSWNLYLFNLYETIPIEAEALTGWILVMYMEKIGVSLQVFETLYMFYQGIDIQI